MGYWRWVGQIARAVTCGMLIELSGCGSSSNQQPAPDRPVTFTVDDRPVVTDPVTGQISSGQENLDQLADKVNSGQPDREIALGRYRLTFTLRQGVLGGCINREVRYLDVQVRNSQNNLFLINFRTAVWLENGSPELGLISDNSCATTRGTYTYVKRAITNFYIAAGLSPQTAAILAAVTAVVVIALLVIF